VAKYLRYGDKGEGVKRVQRLVNRNPFYKPRRKLRVDGHWGPLTSGGVQNCKKYAGYAGNDIKPIAGGAFIAYMSGTKPLTERMKKRRAARLEARKEREKTMSGKRGLRLRALKIIKGEIGTMERGENVIKYNSWWGWGAVAYCVIGISWAWVQAGSKAFQRGKFWANTDAMLNDAQAGRNGLHLTESPSKGCPGVIDFEGHSNPDHAITFIRYQYFSGKRYVLTAEFNTTKDGTSIEGVWMKLRPANQCWWFVPQK
jgi:peptidoglycan hydrolase-like protein with peptidoglycan-binding domain